MSDVPRLDWAALIWETQGFLGLDDADPVPKDELKETALANGWNEREFEKALRATDAVKAAGDPFASNPDLQLSVDAPESGNTGETDADDHGREQTPTENSENLSSPDARSTNSGWSDADFTTPESEVWPDEQLDREQWMGHVDKKPFAPWGDRDHPDADSEEDARWKWGITDNYVDGETIAMAEVDNRLDGRAFLQQPDDPYVYVDGDDVRDRETGEVHPAFEAILEHLGLTYADISQSGAGVHAQYRGDFPEGVKQAAWQLDDEPWGSNDELPSIEIYPGKRVCVATGEHVPGTPTEINEWNADVLEPLLEANDQKTDDRSEISTAREDYDLDDYEPAATTASETTDDIRDVFAALDRLDARRVADRTIVHRWNDSASTSAGKRAFAPTWGRDSNGTANVVDDQIWQDTGDLGGYGGPVTMAAIDAGEISPANAQPVKGETWWRGVEHLRKLGFDIPKLDRSASSSTDDESEADGELPGLLKDALDADEDVESQSVSSMPLAQLDALPPAERKRAARDRGLDWPSTREARDQLLATITEVMANEDDRVIDAPTSLGKSYTISSTNWGDPQYDAVTGGRTVVHLSQTRDARDEAIENAREADIDFMALQSRHEACPVAAGDYDPPKDDEGIDYTPITMDGMPASEWIEMMCDGRGIAFSEVHRRLEDHNDQSTTLPCCQGSNTTYDEDEGDFDDGEESTCPAIKQWERFREGDYPLVIATHQFAHAPGLRMHTNIIFDEEPDFAQELGQDRIRRAVTAFLQEVNAEVRTFEDLIGVAEQGLRPNEHDPRNMDQRWEDLHADLHTDPDREWYFEDDRAHTLAPALARAILSAEDRGNGRRAATVPHEPPRLDAHASDEDSWNRTWVTLVMTDDHDINAVWATPDLNLARSVIGLDAHPALPVWQRQTLPHIERKRVLDPEERQLWRRYERGLRVVQVGEHTHPLASEYAAENYFHEDKTRAVIEHLNDSYGQDFRTAITTKRVEDRLGNIMDDVGIHSVETMHYGEEKSRNDFANEQIGFVNGCIDPGDDFVLDLVAALDIDAEPEMEICKKCSGIGCDDDADCLDGKRRAFGRGFAGQDAETAEEILASVRENHTAQAAGRYARNPTKASSTATVFVRTDAMPTGFADIKVPGVEWVFTETQREIVEVLRDAPGMVTTREVADEVDCSKEHVRKTLARLADRDDPVVDTFEGAGPNGATLYGENGCPNSGIVDVQPTTNGHVLDSYTWSLAIREPSGASSTRREPEDAPSTTNRVPWRWRGTQPGGESG